MAHVFTPGLKVTERARVARRRRLPIDGTVLVQAGARVEPDTVVARTQLPGKIFPLNLANLLHVEPADVPSCMRVAVGESFAKGRLLAETAGLLGMFRTQVRAPMDGSFAAVSAITGQAMLQAPPTPIELRAYVAGEVGEVLPREGVVVETEAAFIQGIFGVGGETYGEIAVVARARDVRTPAEALSEAHRGKVVVCGSSLDLAGLRRAIDLGIAAVVVGGFEYGDIKALLGTELGVAITGSEKLGTTLVVTEGFGDIAMAPATFELLRAHVGEQASVNGATQIRAGVIRPEIVIPLPDRAGARPADAAGAGLDVGSRVRGIRHPYFGRIGEVTALPAELTRLESETMVRVLEVRFEDGERAVLPRSNIEAIEA